MSHDQLDAAIAELEAEMPDLQLRHRDLFAYAHAWAERYDRILSATPDSLQVLTTARLQRIGIRWGVANGARVTTQFPALKLTA